ncbi:MAG: aldehyde dehydrogenase family protein [Phycisphaerales bacterium]|nr:aldehyde dehydrogenase family protein [Phycisphaerales bacterium]
MIMPHDFVGDREIPIPGDSLVSINPADPSEVVFSAAPVDAHADEAVGEAREAFEVWSRWPFERRVKVLQRFKEIAASRVDEVALLISRETGKVFWDSKAEAGLLASKVDITLDTTVPNAGMARVSGYEVPATETRVGRCWFRPHGVMAVIGPFNFPAHLPNGHIIPALAMGNTVVFKPSDKAPAVGQVLASMYREALAAEGAPLGVVNLVQGGAGPASKLVAHNDIDGVLFTGSWPVGRRILEANLDNPGRIIALEMGGNNAALVMPDADLRQAAIECVRAAFVTTGQRCTCTRRVIVHESVADRFIGAVCKAASLLVIGKPDAEHPVFMGPIISAEARDAVLEFQHNAADAGAELRLQARAISEHGEGYYLSPGVMKVDRFSIDDGPGRDEEVFGPLLRISVSDSLDDMIAQANATRFGLAASIFSSDEQAIARFMHEARAGCVNVNTGTAGASSKLPFGGLGHSGNHRPAGAYSLDYCAYPVAGLIERGDAAGLLPGMAFEDKWLG